ncbi:hypothetical protein PV350_08105 [Streptomyces sp. PA03-6a]|nr:hypothetical protein [Streptomyces sp. PA03-6a]
MDVTPGTVYNVTVGQGGIGANAIGVNGTNGANTVLSGPSGILARGDGGTGGRAGLLPLTPSPGGNGFCSVGGTTRQGAAGQPPVVAQGLAGPGGQPAVSGIVEPAPQGAGTGGDGTVAALIPADNGGDGYAVIWW